MTSDLLPRLGAMADRMCFIHSMVAKSNTHGPGESQMSTGFTLDGFPSMGAWVSYALGSENADLPGYVLLFEVGGLYEVTLTVTDDEGASDTDSLWIDVIQDDITSLATADVGTQWGAVTAGSYLDTDAAEDRRAHV